MPLGPSLRLVATLTIAFLYCFPNLLATVTCAIAQYIWYQPAGRENPQRARRRLATYTFPYPNGWYRLCDSHELKPGEVRDIAILGHDFAVFRGELSGRVGVVDAYCPHLGAHMAIGGKASVAAFVSNSSSNA
jgi:cholesterol 7-dehydrogenase